MLKEQAGHRAGLTINLRLGDCVEVMKNLGESSVGVVVCDPPYG